MATAPSSGAVIDAKSPWKAAIGVRAADTMTTGSRFVSLMFQLLDDAFDNGGDISETRGIGREHVVLR